MKTTSTSPRRLAPSSPLSTGLLLGLCAVAAAAFVVIISVVVLRLITPTSTAPEPAYIPDPGFASTFSPSAPFNSVTPTTFNASNGLIVGIPTPKSQTPRLVLDQSYWRLARAGKAQIIPGTEHYIYPKDPAADPYNLANFRDVDLDTVTLQGLYLGWFNVYGSLATSGTIVCRLHSETQEITVSVPTLSPELQTLVDSRGDNYLLVYTENVGVEPTAMFLIYPANATLSLIQHSEGEPILALPYACQGTLSCVLLYDNNIHYIVWPADTKTPERTFAPKATTLDSDAWSTGRLHATPTTFSASPQQVEILKNELGDAESIPLPLEILQNLTTSPE